jgi:alkylation response protein AidB-like acyl-CoA dehydrogenase
MSDVESFRRDLRAFLERELPEKLGELPPNTAEFWGGQKPDLPHPNSARYCELMAERGLTAPLWPKEYGGGGLDKQQAKVLQDELKRLQLPPPLVGFGLVMIGPTLLQYGSDDQKREHLPKIVRGQIRWVQGYSEPNAGSDLAAVATSARFEGDELVLNGQKVWTSYGEKGDWMFALVRTDAHVKKQEGITFLLLDMHQPGVETRPIKLISGSSPFCETFFTDARAHSKNIIYGLGKGWTVAKALLGHERNMIGDVFGTSVTSRRKGGEKNVLAELARDYIGDRNGQVADPVVRDRVTQITMDERVFALTMQRSADNLKAGHRPGAESSIFKIYGTELNQRRHELMLAIRGPQAMGWEGPGFDDKELAQTRDWLRSRGNTIEGGTSEVQLNIIAKHVLDLPD